MHKFTIFISCALTGLALFLSLNCPSFADTVIFKDGKRAKGLILDEFKDRIVLSTIEGEKVIPKSKIRSAVYDSEEKALMQEARNQMKKNQHIKAYYTYKKVLELDPEMKEARERMDYLKGYLEEQTKGDIMKSVRNRQERLQGASGKTPVQRAREELGLFLETGEKYVFVRSNNSSGSSKKIKAGDSIVSVWGEMAAYMDADEVANMLLVPGETRCVIERALKVDLYKGHAKNNLFSNGYERIIGAKLELEKRGVIVKKVSSSGPFSEAGIKRGDLIERINGKNTRYMPMSKIIDLIKENKEKKMDIVIRRGVVFWRKGKTS